jgi:lambda family phage portal protein
MTARRKTSRLPRARAAAPTAAMATSASTAHVAADVTDKALASWTPPAGSADADLLNELGTIVPRSRDLARNNGIAASGQQTLKDNIVGHQLKLSSKPHYRLLGKDTAWAEDWGNRTEAEFETWANVPECDAARSMTLLGLTIQGLGGALLNGEALCLPRWIERPGERWGTKLQLIEADRLATPPGMDARRDLRGGIEIDGYGAPRAYWIQKSHPGEWLRYGAHYLPLDFERVEAFLPNGLPRVIHLHDKERTGQSRGKPIVTAVMREFRMAGHYQTIELQRAIANSLIAAFLESNLDPESSAQLFGNDPKAAWDTALGGFKGQLKGAAVIPLPAGAHLTSFTPSSPNAAFGAFMEAALRHIAAGLNLPYELLLKDFSKMNYSSARAALLEAWRFFLGRRRWLRDYWLNPIYQLWLEEAAWRGRIGVTHADYLANRYAYARCRWVFAGRGWVDPVKEATAAKIRKDEYFSTLEDECAEQGLDWEDVLEQRARELARMRELGLPATPAATMAVTVGADRPEPPDDLERNDPEREEQANAA